jgi:pimeloyl-ACP methyl ester carboxylesterase
MMYIVAPMSIILRLAALLAVLLAAGLVVGYFYESAARSRERAAHKPPGKMVEIESRKVHILCKGVGGGPTVVIEPGAAEPAMLWWGVQDAVAAFARVCTYDRPGYQWSDPAIGPRSIADRARELRRVLAAADVPGPYVLVSHSYGGAIVRAWLREGGTDVAGLIFVDTPDEGNLFSAPYRRVIDRGRWILPTMAFAMRCGVFRALSAFAGEGDSDPPLSPEARRHWTMAFTPQSFDAAADDLASIANATPGERAPIAPGALGDLPIVVVAHGIPFPVAFASLEQGFRESQFRLAALSSRGEFVVADRANHNINVDQPEIVVDAIRRVIAEASRRSSH